MIYGPQRPIPAGFAPNSWYNMLFLTDATTRRLAYIPSVASTVFGYDENNLPSMLTMAHVAWTGQYADLLGLPTLGTAAASASTDFATAAQGATADSALQSSAIGVSIEAHSTNLDNLGANAPAYYLSRANQTGTQLASTISDFSAASLLAVTWSTITGKPTFGTASAQNTSAFDASGAATTAQAFAIQRANHTGTQLASTISDFSAAALLAVTWTTLTGKPTFATVATTGAYSDLSGKPTIPAAQVNSDWNASSGLAQILNKPTLPTGTVTSVGLTAISSDITLTGTSPITTSGTFALSLAAAGTAGTYQRVTTDAKGRVTAGVNPTTNNAVSRSLNTTFTISATQAAQVSYTIRIAYTITVLLGSTGSISLQYSTDAGSTWITVSTTSNNLNLGLALTGYNDFNIGGYIPANALVKILSSVTNATNTYQTGQEVLQ